MPAKKHTTTNKTKSKEQRIFRCENRRSGYVRLDKQILNNLSLQSVGMMAYLLSKPNHWNFVSTNIIKDLGITEYTFEKIVKELKSKGYLIISRYNNPIDGRWSAAYRVYESPALNSKFVKKMQQQEETN